MPKYEIRGTQEIYYTLEIVAKDDDEAWNLARKSEDEDWEEVGRSGIGIDEIVEI